MSYIYVGLFSAMIMSLALLGDLIFMPALLYLVDGKSSIASNDIESNSRVNSDENAGTNNCSESDLKSHSMTLDN